VGEYRGQGASCENDAEQNSAATPGRERHRDHDGRRRVAA
jgi:hypothetical protein